jgi:ribosome-associated toxin RatA of RatAB toxin-antitoxin module
MQLVNGPFSRLDGQWRFHAAGRRQPAGLPRRTGAALRFDNATLGRLVGPVFDRIAGSLVDAFVKRAEQVYG